MTTEELLAEIHDELEQIIGLLNSLVGLTALRADMDDAELPGPRRGRRRLGRVALPPLRRRDGGAISAGSPQPTASRRPCGAPNARSRRPGSWPATRTRRGRRHPLQLLRLAQQLTTDPGDRGVLTVALAEGEDIGRTLASLVISPGPDVYVGATPVQSQHPAQPRRLGPTRPPASPSPAPPRSSPAASATAPHSGAEARASMVDWARARPTAKSSTPGDTPASCNPRPTGSSRTHRPGRLMPTQDYDTGTGPRRPRPDYSQASGTYGSPAPTTEAAFLEWLASQTDSQHQPYLTSPWQMSTAAEN
jgi:hypothetical protein